MAKRTPSYLIKRGSIYYFNMRNPRYKNSIVGLTKIIRISTGTGNYTQAVKIAKLLWTYIMEDKYIDKIYNAELAKELKNKKRKIIEDLISNGSNIGDLISSISCEYERGEYISGLSEKEKLSFHLANYLSGRLSDVLKEHDYNNVPLSKYDKNFDDKDSLKFIDLVKKYLTYKKNSPKKISYNSLYKIQKHLILIGRMLNNPKVADITNDLIITNFVNLIAHVPKNIAQNDAYKNTNGNLKPMKEIIMLAKNNKAQTMADNTIKNYTNSLHGFLNWCEDNGYLPNNITKSLNGLKGYSSQNKKEVKPFSDDELEKLFHGPMFTNKTYIIKKPERFWVPLLSLFTGARLGEISQLHFDDIFYCKKEKTWVMDINDNGIKILKSKSSKRKIPIPNTIIELGFINFIDYQKARVDSDIIFPNLRPKSKNERWGRNVGRWFNERYILQCGIKKIAGNTKRTFHSLRHQFINETKQQEIDQSISREIVGHSNSKDVHSDYEEAYTLGILKEAINKVIFPIDIDKLYKWTKKSQKK